MSVSERTSWLCTHLKLLESNMASVKRLALVLILGALLHVTDAQTEKPCDEGWILNNQTCYLFMNKTEASNRDAYKICRFRSGAATAYTRNEHDLDFLSKTVKTFDTYGWALSLTRGKDSKGSMYYQMSTFGRSHTNRRFGDNGQFPEPHVDPSGNLTCVAYRPKYFNSPEALPAGMTTVDCHILLPYVCTGSTDSITPTGSSHWIQNGGQEVFWASDSTDRLNYLNAENACKSKGMALLSIRNRETLALIETNLAQLSQNKLEPWWTGLNVIASNEPGIYTYSWRSDVPMDETVITWLQQVPDGDRHVLLLGSGGGLYPESYSAGPFICMKRAWEIQKNNCSAGWVQVGRSCYMHYNEEVTWDSANYLCSQAGSHLLTIETEDELISLLLSRLWRVEGTVYGEEVWISLNDKQNEGIFVWDDGSMLNTSVVNWIQFLSPAYSRFECMLLYVGETLRRNDCDRPVSYGCMYTSSTGGCIDDKWSYFNGHCYLTRYLSFPSRANFSNAMQKCNAIIAKQGITAELLKFETEEEYNFYSSHFDTYNYNNDIGIGLNSRGHPGEWLWADGTRPNLTFLPYPREPSTGSEAEGADCVYLFGNLDLGDADCNRTINHYICESELLMEETN